MTNKSERELTTDYADQHRWELLVDDRRLVSVLHLISHGSVVNCVLKKEATSHFDTISAAAHPNVVARITLANTVAQFPQKTRVRQKPRMAKSWGLTVVAA
jgi:hypothetical protein